MKNKIEDFLICLTLCREFNFKFENKDIGQLALVLITVALPHTQNINDIFLLIAELPNILSLPYLANVKQFKRVLAGVLETYKLILQDALQKPEYLPPWKDYVRFEYTIKLLNSVG